MTLMGTVFPKLTEGNVEEKVGVWHLLLADLDYQLAQQAVVKMLRHAKYEPKPADIIEVVRSMQQSNIPTAEEAWDEVQRNLDPYRTPEWSHELIGQATRTMGGVRVLCESINPGIDRAQFIKIYNNLLNRKQDQAENIVVVRLVGNTIKLIG